MSNSTLSQKNNGSIKSPKTSKRKKAIFTLAVISSLVGINIFSSAAHAGNGYYNVYGPNGSVQSCKVFHWGVSCY